METLAPPLQSTIDILYSLENGMSVRLALQEHLKTCRGEWKQCLVRLLTQGHDQTDVETAEPPSISPYRESLLDLFSRGLRGEAIVSKLKEIEIEMKKECERQIEDHIRRLPFIMLIPLMGLQFPAFLALILGPLSSQLLGSLNS